MAYLGNSPVLSQQEYRNIDNISGSFNGSTTSFPLLVSGVAPVPAPQSSNQCLISVNGVVQKPDDTGASGFRISGGNIIFSAAPTGGQSFFGVILAGADYVYAGENFPDGTVSAPSITFAQDLDTGFFRSGAGEIKYTANGTAVVTLSSNNLTAPSFIPTSSSAPTNGVYLPSANNVAISTNGTGRLFVDSSGNLLTNSTSPSTVWSSDRTFAYVKGNAVNKSGEIIVESNNGNQQASFFASNGTAEFGLFSAKANSLVLGTNNQERLRITSAGLVGVGTTSPGSFVGSVNVTIGSAATTTTTAAVNIYSGNATYGGLYFADGTVGDQLYRGSVEYKHDVDALAFGSAGTERARIDSSGRLLLGTSTAGSNYRVGTSSFTPTLQVEGTNVSPLAIQRTDGAPYLYLATGVNVSSGSQIGYISFNAKDGTNLVQAASIGAECDGTPGTNDMPGRLVFSTTADGASSPTERMRIENNGRIGTFTGSQYAFTVRSSNGAGTTNILYAGTYSATGTGDGTLSYQVFTNGNVQNTNNSYTAISDIKLKENIVDANSQWDDLKAIKVRNYNLREGQTHKQIGLIAQEVEPISPGLVYESTDRDEDGNDLGTVTKSVNYSVLYMKAVKALQEAMERIETLEQRLNDAGIN